MSPPPLTYAEEDGDFVVVPRGTRHRVRDVGLHVSRMLFVFTPSYREKLFMEIGQEARAGEAPLPRTPSQEQQIVDFAPRHDLKPAP